MYIGGCRCEKLMKYNVSRYLSVKFNGVINLIFELAIMSYNIIQKYVT